MKIAQNKRVLFLMIVAVVLTACGPDETPTAAEQMVVESIATNTPEPPKPTATATEPPPTETPAPTPTSDPTPTEEVVVEVADQCLSCHSDKDQLVDTAKPEELVPNESSGVG